MLRELLRRWVAPSAEKVLPESGVSEWVARALEHHRTGNLAEALVLYEKALARNPLDINALHFSGVIAYEDGQFQRAENLIGRALALNAANAPAHNNLGNVHLARGRTDEAVASYQRAIALQPDFADAYVNLGSVLAKEQKLDDAAACYRHGLAAAPQSASLHLGLASVLTDRGMLAEAETGFRRALALKPDYPEAHNGLGTALLASGRADEAVQAFRQALAGRPGFARARFGCALALLMTGNYAEGLPLYEARFEEANAAQRARLAELQHVMRWQGGEAPGGKLLVWADQGIGDMLMCARYLPLLKQRGFEKVLVESGQPLVRVLRAVPGVDDVVPQGNRLPLGEFDWHCPMGSMPLAFSTRLDSIPRVPYLTVPDGMSQEWRARMERLGQDGLRVGIAWAGRADFPRDALRSIRLERFAPLFEGTGTVFFSLQKGEPASQLAQTGFAIHDWTGDCKDLLDTAALIEQLDLVITVDTAIVHLAAALGRPTWLLNRFESEWRWMLGREDCAWYPTVRIFRQARPGDWRNVMDRVAAALKDEILARP